MQPVSTTLILTDALEDMDVCAPPIAVGLEFANQHAFGIIVGFSHPNSDKSRIVIENKEGQLVCHIWSTIESIGNDPTHSVVIEPDEEEA